ncbi:carbohydrate ABC transporter permease [Nonomuraea soli]|uniref:Raffinose/stachyose/melibiose transport system permease protein n=1 Tax=Nonomuraea soli TaxID=1032476 RepID=A0A7W0HR75_9ACTN|nr:sugar ABC transporter permease [Nonomuraea soli]MBA2892331.1 raffinose/stachyose/melibiose transport system permease protein [Nonomuraea soli]
MAASTTPGGALHVARRRLYLPMLLPALLAYLVFFVVPSLFGVVLSFGEWSGLGTEFSWVGLANYTGLLTSELFVASFLNTLLLTVIVGGVLFLIAAASMVVLRTARAGAFIRSAIFLPFMISPIAVGLAVSFLFNPEGVINTALEVTGLSELRRPWLGPDLIFQVIMAGVVWSAAGFYVVLVMSAVDGIPPSLFEVARIEGAGPLQQFRYITLPLTRDMLGIAAALWAIAGIKTFELIIAFVGTAGTPPPEARTLAVEQYLRVTGGRVGGLAQLGEAAAIGVLMTAITAVLIVLSRRIQRRDRLEWA